MKVKQVVAALCVQPPPPSHSGSPVRPEHRPAAEPGPRGLGPPRRHPAGQDSLDAGAGHCTVSEPQLETFVVNVSECVLG